ncbi:thioredoxin family protein [Sulfurimonas sp. HSL-1656]|uniref:thioredoxin family protein n=1 Tax=Thiomicrolovo subterrani TaxID=3131934 RepID=UPI0031F73894
MFRMFLLGFALLLGGCGQEKTVHETMLNVTPYKLVAPKIGRGKPVLLELGSTSCRSCEDMARTLYRIKKEHPRSGIYFIDIRRERHVAVQYDVRMMPTQVILDGSGQVVYRHIGPAAAKELTETLTRFGVLR